MKHHTPEEWLRYLDGEAPPELARTLSEHLASCPPCAAELQAWQRSADRLRRLTFPPARQSPLWKMAAVKIGLAAAIALFLGVAVGRLSQPDLEEVRQSVAAQLRQEMRQELHEELVLVARGMEQQRQSGERRMLAAVEGVREQNASDCLALRQDLETAVSEADTGLRQNSHRIAEIASAISTKQP